ncbi:unnamed protein product, partial [Symbiodinium sp. CCMP2456]
MFADALAWLLREDRPNAVIATLTEGIAFRTQHGRHACRGRASRIPHEDALAQRVARAVLAAQQQEELRSQFGDFLDSWMNADAARDAVLEEGMAFRLQHDPFPRRGREAELEGEDALYQRIARAVPLAQQQEELRSQFGDFLDSWMNADAARDAALEAARCALQEGMAFRLQHDRFPRRGREELRSQFGDFLDSWMDADAARDAALEAARCALQ